MSLSMSHAARQPGAILLALVLLLGAVLVAAPSTAADDDDRRSDRVRFATFNASLNRGVAGQAKADLSAPGNPQAAAVAEIIQRTRPEVLLINEFDFLPNNELATLFQDNYLSVSHNGSQPIEYPYVYVAESNTGIPSGLDFSNDGTVGGPNDAFGFGFFPGQFGMAVFSQHPINHDDIRTFQRFRWKDMPGALLPDNPATPATPADWYSASELEVFRLSSKSHWDVPIEIDGEIIHFLVSHPTPPVFDDPPFFPAGVDFNGRRNFDEIRLWADYIRGGSKASYIYDDAGTFGGLARGASFVIAGDQNSDPRDGDSVRGAIQQLLDNRRIDDGDTPSSKGAREASKLQGGINTTHRSNPKYDTADFADTAPGNLRADYVLPSRDLDIDDSGVFWPLQRDPLFRLTGVFTPTLPGGFPSSDHRLVWIDLELDSDDDDDDDDDDD